MNGETDLQILIKEMKPQLNSGEYVFCLVNTIEIAMRHNPICIFTEMEGVTLILTRQGADEGGLTYQSIFAWITLTVHSSLEAVGLTAVVSHALADAQISCNMVAAFHHDHIFVPTKEAHHAMHVLTNLAGAGNE